MIIRTGFAGCLALTLAAAASGQDSAPPGEVMRVYDIVGAVSAERIEADIRTLADFGTRHTASQTQSDTRGIGAARRWIFEEFEDISAACGGCLEVVYVTGTIEGERRIPDPVDVVSVLAIQRGSLDPDRVVMMSGDIDSRASDVMDAEIDSPGANDNASGVAGALEAARVLSQHEFAGTIVYAALAGEEQGLFGGEIVAAWALEQGWRIKAVLNNDMIGNIAGIDGVIDNSTIRVFSEGTRADETEQEARIRRFTGGEVDSPSRNIARYIDAIADQYVTNLDVMMIYRLDRFGRGGHHRPFNEAGMPAVRLMETHEHYDRQHQDIRNEEGRHFGDTVEFVDFDYAASATSLNAATLALLAGAPPIPADVSIEGAVQPDTTLSWALPDGDVAGNLAGYRVHWRRTDAPQWTFSRWVGMTDSYTLENIVIDNFYFGVSAVAADGSQTPVVFPGPAGDFGGY
jgi:hypothetical protein